MKSISIQENHNSFDIFYFNGILILPKDQISLILEDWGYSEIINNLSGSEMISFWENDFLIFLNKWGSRFEMNLNQFKNEFLR